MALNVLFTKAEMLVALTTIDANPDDLEIPKPVTLRVHAESPAETL